MKIKTDTEKIIEKINQNDWTEIMENINKLLAPEIADIILSIEEEKNQFKLFKLYC